MPNDFREEQWWLWVSQIRSSWVNVLSNCSLSSGIPRVLEAKIYALLALQWKLSLCGVRNANRQVEQSSNYWKFQGTEQQQAHYLLTWKIATQFVNATDTKSCVCSKRYPILPSHRNASNTTKKTKGVHKREDLGNWVNEVNGVVTVSFFPLWRQWGRSQSNIEGCRGCGYW